MTLSGQNIWRFAKTNTFIIKIVVLTVLSLILKGMFLVYEGVRQSVFIYGRKQAYMSMGDCRNDN